MMPLPANGAPGRLWDVVAMFFLWASMFIYCRSTRLTCSTLLASVLATSTYSSDSFCFIWHMITQLNVFIGGVDKNLWHSKNVKAYVKASTRLQFIHPSSFWWVWCLSWHLKLFGHHHWRFQTLPMAFLLISGTKTLQFSLFLLFITAVFLFFFLWRPHEVRKLALSRQTHNSAQVKRL